MAVKHYTLTLTGAVQRLSTVLTDPTPGGKDDLPCRLISFQPGKANNADVFVGGSDQVSSSDYGVRLDPTDTQPCTVLGHFDMGPYKLSNFYVIGTAAEKLHILTVPY